MKIGQVPFLKSKPKKVEDVTIESLQAENQKLKDQVEDLTQENTLVMDINKELTLKIEELSQLKRPEIIEAKAAEKTPTLPSETFDVDGVSYRFTAPAFIYQGKKHIAAEALNDTALLAELVAKKIGFVTQA